MNEAQRNQKLKIYVAGPYTAQTIDERRENVNRAIDVAIHIFKKGHFPYIPHLTHFVDERAKEIGIDLQWDDYIAWDLAWLELCDALLMLGSSKGADMELEHAKKLGLRIFSSVEEITNENTSRSLH